MMTTKMSPLATAAIVARASVALLPLLLLAVACGVYRPPTSETPVDGRVSWMHEEVLDRKSIAGVESPRARSDWNLWASAELLQSGPDFNARFAEMRWLPSPDYDDATNQCFWYARYNLDTLLFASGAGVHLMWGPTLRDGDNAPAEAWSDPALAFTERLARYREAVGAERPPYRNLYPIFVPFRSADPHYTQEIDPPLDTDVLPEDASKNLWDPRRFDRTITPATIGFALYAESQLARHFFREWRPGVEGRRLAGASAAEGWLGCHLVEMAASQIRVVARDFFWDPEHARFSPLNAARHDATRSVRFIPHVLKPQMTSVDLLDSAGRPPRWQFLEVADARSSLYDQAALLLGLVEFLKLTAPGTPFSDLGLFGEGPEALFSNTIRAEAEGLAWAIVRNIDEMHFDADRRVYVSFARNATRYPEKTERGQFLYSLDAGLLCQALAGFLEFVPESNRNERFQVTRMLDIEAGAIETLQYSDGAFAESYDVTTGRSTKPQSWTLATQGAVVRGLLAAHDVNGKYELRRAAERNIECIFQAKLWSRDKKLFKSEQVIAEGAKFSVYTPLTFSAGTSALREWAITKRDEPPIQPPASTPSGLGLFAADRNQPPILLRFREFVSGFPHAGLILAELAQTGEITFDSWDSDNDGLPKPRHAGGAYGIAPVFCEAVLVKLP